MNKSTLRPMNRGRRIFSVAAATLLGAAAIGGWALGSPAYAATTTAAVAAAADTLPSFAISVADFRDAGGATYKGPDGKPLTDRLATALRSYLTDGATRGHYLVLTGDKTAGKSVARFLVEGDLSAIQIGDPDQRRYMLVARVFRLDSGGKERKLVAQFAGTAGLRDLTGNMGGQAGMSRMGLAGELAKEIADAAEGTLPSGDAFDDMVQKATALHRVTVDVIGDTEPKPRSAVAAGEKFRLRVSSQESGKVYLIGLDPATKRPVSLYSQDDPLDVTVGHPVVLPPVNPLVAPQVTAPATLEYVVFVRHRAEAGHAAATAASAIDPTAMVASTAPIAPPVMVARRGRAIEPTDTGKTEKIELLSCVAPSVGGSSMDAGIATLLALYQSDPTDNWIGVRVKVAVTPTAAH